jgi:hypothetical protein
MGRVQIVVCMLMPIGGGMFLNLKQLSSRSLLPMNFSVPIAQDFDALRSTSILCKFLEVSAAASASAKLFLPVKRQTPSSGFIRAIMRVHSSTSERLLVAKTRRNRGNLRIRRPLR